MEIAEARVHRLLTYIDAAERQGSPVTREQALAFADVTAAHTGMVAKWLFLEDAQVGPLTWLAKTEWVLRGRDDRLVLSDLGRAMLRELDARQRRAVLEPPRAFVLKAGDPFALSELIAEIGELGPAALLDPYLDVPSLRSVVEGAPDVRRILTGAKPDKRVRALRHAAHAAPNIAIRVGGDGLHERAVVPDGGGYWTLSNSINGIGRTMATMVLLPDSVTPTAREGFEGLWSSAEPLIEAMADGEYMATPDTGRQAAKRPRAS